MALHCLSAVSRCCRAQPLPLPLPLSTGRARLPAVQAALISGKTMRGGPKSWKRDPWPYKQKAYTGLKSYFDTTRSRWDDNTKLIVVEGPPGAGKTQVARALADEFEMQYMPPASGDILHVNDYGFDLRGLNAKLPYKVQLLEPNDFLKNPYDVRIGAMQMRWLEFKLSQYIDALAHFMNTGQGVVMNKCVLSDYVYVEAMCRSGYVSRGVRSVYREVAASALALMLPPHLVVYLDIPVEEVKRRVKARARPHEVDSPALTDQFLSELESAYKTDWLPKVGDRSEVLTYDMTADVPIEHIVDDIEHLDFDNYAFDSDKLRDWRLSAHGSTEDYWDSYRTQVTNYKDQLMNNMMVPRFDVPELMGSQDDMKLFNEIYREDAPGQRFQYGFNPGMGDSVLFKLGDGGNYRQTTRY